MKLSIFADKIIVGSLNGILRIYSVGFNATEEGLLPFQANHLLMEIDFKTPILQVCAGLLLSATTNIQLAVLHPKKLSIYSISCKPLTCIMFCACSFLFWCLNFQFLTEATAGVTEHGSAYNILLIYEHLLKRSAFFMTLGPFGHIRGQTTTTNF